MTNEERDKAIRILQWLHDNKFLFASTEEDVKYATENAIKALEQEPCEDAISRKSLKHKLQEQHDFFVNAYGGFSNLPQNDKARVDEISNCIAMVVNEPSVKPQEPKTEGIRGDIPIQPTVPKMPSIQPKPKTDWIPVSERLPEKNMACLVAVGRFNFTQIAVCSDLMGTIDRQIFYQGDVGHDNFKNITQYVKAWMPLPKPYF